MEAVKLIKDISQKTQIINDTAFETHLLSLNASIESSKAGTAGKGYSVVANQIRQLSQKSNSVSEEIKKLAFSGSAITENLREKLEQTLTENIESLKLIESITLSEKEQRNGAESVSHSVQNLTSITNKNSSAAEILAQSAKSLAGQAQNLKTSLSE